ncbi:hypothetical protein L1887_27994 [Cichorium endivia]|nr:hypothetical protein L1887_27994 [Cichorium endivia]
MAVKDEISVKAVFSLLSTTPKDLRFLSKLEGNQRIICRQSLEIQLKKKTKEAADSLELLESLREKLKQKTMNEEDFQQRKLTISQLDDESKKQQTTISRLNDENEKQKTTISRLNDKHEKQKITISHLNGENKKQKSTISRLNDDISQLNSENEKQKTTISQPEKKLQANCRWTLADHPAVTTPTQSPVSSTLSPVMIPPSRR